MSRMDVHRKFQHPGGRHTEVESGVGRESVSHRDYQKLRIWFWNAKHVVVSEFYIVLPKEMFENYSCTFMRDENHILIVTDYSRLLLRNVSSLSFANASIGVVFSMRQRGWS